VFVWDVYATTLLVWIFVQAFFIGCVVAARAQKVARVIKLLCRTIQFAFINVQSKQCTLHKVPVCFASKATIY